MVPRRLAAASVFGPDVIPLDSHEALDATLMVDHELDCAWLIYPAGSSSEQET
jgi:hypothetical protein